MATLLLFTLFWYAPTAIMPIDGNSILPVAGIIFVLTYILPVISVLTLKLTKSISSLKMEIRRERLLPFSFITMWYGLTAYFFISKPTLGISFMVMFVCMTITGLLVTVVTSFFKISAHTAGSAGFVGLLLVFHLKYLDSMLFVPIMVAFVLHGAVSSARLYLNSHSPLEVHLGSLLGFAVNFTTAFLLL
ncbi:hypothetical protein [Fulvivirga ligni]|uniref:hypothetical protein n=1 Tax=Fulvivirga ligni TaxID=2904246 RepID=UPI001F249752|nr:hypothetical protein [Fulvivirga ligni]UII21265.1 hypothetical protein LVD16_25875 [Fulvivirga ligni]